MRLRTWTQTFKYPSTEELVSTNRTRTDVCFSFQQLILYCLVHSINSLNTELSFYLHYLHRVLYFPNLPYNKRCTKPLMLQRFVHKIDAVRSGLVNTMLLQQQLIYYLIYPIWILETLHIQHVICTKRHAAFVINIKIKFSCILTSRLTLEIFLQKLAIFVIQTKLKK